MTHKSKKKNIVFQSSRSQKKVMPAKQAKALMSTMRRMSGDPSGNRRGGLEQANTATGVDNYQTVMADGAAALFNQGFRLEITHVPSDRTLYFPAFVEQFSDAYNSEWNAEHVFGRMDPIATFMHTRRAISVAWKIPAASEYEAMENMNKVNELMTYLYPQYDGVGGCATSLTMAPLLRVKFGNLIQDGNGNAHGLLGYINGFTMDPLFEEGTYMYSSRGPLRSGGVEYLPKTIRLNFEMTVLHEHSLGWTDKGGKTKKETAFAGGARKGFPYAVAKAPDHMPFTNAFKNSDVKAKDNPDTQRSAPGDDTKPIKQKLAQMVRQGWGGKTFRRAYGAGKQGILTVKGLQEMISNKGQPGYEDNDLSSSEANLLSLAFFPGD